MSKSTLQSQLTTGTSTIEIHLERDQWFVEHNHGAGTTYLYVGYDRSSAFIAADAAFRAVAATETTYDTHIEAEFGDDRNPPQHTDVAMTDRVFNAWSPTKVTTVDQADLTRGDDDSLSTFASDLGLPPGVWPLHIDITTPATPIRMRRAHHLTHGGDVVGMVYTNPIRRFQLVIYND